VIADRAVTVHDATGATIATLTSAKGGAGIVGAGFDASGARLALVSDHVRVYDVAKDTLVADVPMGYPAADEPGFLHVTFDPSGKYVLLSSVGVAAYDLTTLKPLATTLDTDTGGTFATVVSPDGRFVAAASEDGHALRVWHTISWAPIATLGHVTDCANHFNVIAFVQGGKRLVGVANALNLKVYDTSTWKAVVTSTNKDVAGASAFSDDGSIAFTIDGSGKGTAYETATAKIVGAFVHPVSALTPSLDGAFAIDHEGATLALYDARTGSELTTFAR
jgi:WD40 repeat protein